MIGLAWAYLIVRFVLSGAFPRTRKALKAAQMRSKATKAARRVGTW